ncbi:MAG: hypothetical protein DMG68_22290 [Acidobacteria bacterium]|nr:MAG: hypothetical protein DMG68_22290 [Acidobacteriota bacterium]
MATRPKPKLGTRGKPEETRAAILQAAVREFSQEGIAGARTDAIAKAARVNKALLYYYFKDKETLYGAALDLVFGQLNREMSEVLNRDLPPGLKVRTYVGAYFDFIASHPQYRSLVQREMMRAGHGSPHLSRMAKQYFVHSGRYCVPRIPSGQSHALHSFDYRAGGFLLYECPGDEGSHGWRSAVAGAPGGTPRRGARLHYGSAFSLP